jgi:stage V sporulation protein AC
MTNRDYDQFVKKASPNSKSYLNIPKAFVVGGAICTLGQLLLNLYQYLGAPEDLAPTAVSVSLVFLSALLTGLNVYDNIAKHGGAGTLVPITGFANAVASPALEFKNEGLILGVGAKMFVIAGPVIVYGVSSSVIYGLIIYLFGLY